jgi:hypothetical protein
LPGTHKQNTEPAWEFYDLQSDPKENQNAYSNPKYAEVISKLKKELIASRKQVGDTDEKFPEMKSILTANQLE